MRAPTASWRGYTTCFTLIIIMCVLATHHGAGAAERCVRTSGNTMDVEAFRSASPSTISKLLEYYYETRARRPKPPSIKPKAISCITQGNSCYPANTKRRCCGGMGCFTTQGDQCGLGSRCICRNSRYTNDFH